MSCGHLSASWIVTITVVLISAAWLGFFSHQHTEYSHDLWWQFSFIEGGASRFLRGMVGALVVVLFFSSAKLLRPAPAALILPSPTELEHAKPIINQFPETTPIWRYSVIRAFCSTNHVTLS
jgi:phosphatidylglycerol lysyltransferase